MLDLFTQKYPYTDLHELNLDWIISKLIQMNTKLDNFVKLNTIKYADPIGWDITKQYGTNTVVIDLNTGVAYISNKPVPTGVTISDTNYWSPIFDLQEIINQITNNLTFHNNGTSPTLLDDVSKGDWVLWNNILYVALSDMISGTALIENSNVERASVEVLTKTYTDDLGTALNTLIGLLANLNTSDKTSIVNAINSVLSDLSTIIGNLANLTTSDKTSVVNAINSVLSDLSTIIGSLASLTTSDKTSVVNAINSVLSDLSTIIGNLANLTTSDKTSIVNAINSVLSDLNTIIGDLANLTTTDKTNVVNAINSLKSEVSGDITTAINNEINARKAYIHFNPSDKFALDNTGATDCATKFSSITDNVGLKSGTYLINSNCTINCDISFAGGAVIQFGTNVTVTFNGCIIAGRRQIFRGSFTNVSFDSKTNPVGFPEWFGAVANGSTDCGSAIQTTVDRFSITSLTCGRYKISTRINMKTDKTLMGVGDTLHYTNENPDYTGSVIVPDVVNPCINISNTVGTVVKDIIIDAGDTAVDMTGITVSGCIRTKLLDIFIRNCRVGVVWTQNITSYIVRVSGFTTSSSGLSCQAFRLVGGNIGMSSTYMEDCAWGFGGTDTEIGILATGNLNDLYIDKFEVARGSVGIQLNPSGTNIVLNGDMFINNCIIDGTTDTGIRIQATNPNYNYTHIHLTNNWIGFVETDISKYAMDIVNVQGLTITGMEIYSNVSGIRINNSGRVFISDASVVAENKTVSAVACRCFNSFNIKFLNAIIHNFDIAFMSDVSSRYMEVSGCGNTNRGVLLGNGAETYTAQTADTVSNTYQAIVRGPYNFTTA